MKKVVETVQRPFDHIAWAVYLIPCDMNEDGDWCNEQPCYVPEVHFTYLSQALEYMRSWTADAAKALMNEFGVTYLRVLMDKDFYAGPSDDSYDGCIPCVAGVCFSANNGEVERDEFYYDSDVHDVLHDVVRKVTF